MRWWRIFIDKLAGRRRRSERYRYRLSLAARCSSWPKFEELFTGDVSKEGLFVPTEQQASAGETVELSLMLPDESRFSVEGKVVNVVTPEDAARHGKPPGLGILLGELEGEKLAAFQKILEAARAEQPRPVDPPEIELGGAQPTATPAAEAAPAPAAQPQPTPEVTELPAAPLRVSAIHQAVEAPSSMESGEQLAVEDMEEVPEPAAAPPQAVAEEPALAPAPAPAPTPTPHAERAPTPPSSSPRSERRPGQIVGLDLGTTYTSVGAVVGKKVRILERPDGSRSSPSVISFERGGNIYVGAEARQRIATDPGRTVVSPKRVLGRNYRDPEVQTFIGQAPYRTFEGPDGTVVVDIGGNDYAIPQLIAYILKDAKKLAENVLRTEISQAVVSVPISFEDDRVEALRRAGEMAGLEIVAVIDEPSAAALANRFDPNFGGLAGVYDFGGGTFDFSIVDVSAGDFRVLATAGDTWLGGDDFDRVLAEAASNQFWREHKVDLRKQALEWTRLLFACERAKRDLSTSDQAIIHVEDVLRTPEGMVDLRLSIDRAILDRACAAIIQRSLSTCQEALDLLEIRPSDLTTVYLSGGTTYIPAVRDALERYFQVPIRTGVPPEHAVCLGAAIHAAQIQFQSKQTLEAR